MAFRSGSRVQFPDSGYLSDDESRSETKRSMSKLRESLLRCKEEYISSTKRPGSNDGHGNEEESSSQAQSPESGSGIASSALGGIELQDSAVAEIQDEDDSEDGLLRLTYNFPFATPNDFPIVPLPGTLARAGYHAAAAEVNKSCSKGRGKAKTGRKMMPLGVRMDRGQTQGGVASKAVSAGVVVSSKRARYSFADALEKMEGRMKGKEGGMDSV